MTDRSAELEILYDQISEQLTEFMFEPNDELTRRAISKKLNVFMEHYGVYSYTVICDETTLERDDENELSAYVELQFGVGEPHHHVHAALFPVLVNEVVDE